MTTPIGDDPMMNLLPRNRAFAPGLACHPRCIAFVYAHRGPLARDVFVRLRALAIAPHRDCDASRPMKPPREGSCSRCRRAIEQSSDCAAFANAESQ
ncbi:MAG: hypothetical protein IPI27_11500 [Betaproteobacteria bacterium]|nr:hypothetical protein [Betaproteobacteria bacterium]